MFERIKSAFSQLKPKNKEEAEKLRKFRKTNRFIASLAMFATLIGAFILYKAGLIGVLVMTLIFAVVFGAFFVSYLIFRNREK